jgi:carbamoyltransferase
MTAILGVSAFYHDSAAALVVDGKIVAAAQEERFTRHKHDHGFPINAINYCLEEAGLTPEQLDFVGFYDKPFLKFERLLETYLAYAPQGFQSFLQAMPLWLRKKLYLPREMRKGLGGKFRKRFVFTEHHESHAASAFFPSPYQEAALLTIDGVGEWATATCGYGRDNRIAITQQMNFPHSPGLLYSAFTYYGGFTVNSGEYKLMGLAPYGEPTFVKLILDNLIDLKEDGSFRMDMSYFNYCTGVTMTSPKFDRLFGGPPRKPESRVTQRDMDIAASIQKVTEEIMLRMARHAHAQTGMKNLCLAGGVALNCVGNGRILREGPFEDVWIQPAAGDAGGALGVAEFIWYQLLGNERVARPRDHQRGSLLGPEFSDDEIRDFLETTSAAYEYIPDEDRLCDRVATDIADGKVIGWLQGRMEFGPRALGSRSILGDARLADSQAVINMRVKFRESFRPFAPVVLEERAHEFFGIKEGQQSPYMLLVAPVNESKRLPIPADKAGSKGIEKLKLLRSVVPAITHVDYSARVQTIDKERHGLFRRLMEKFDEKTGCPVMMNTSFNLGWDPIVCSPQEAYQTFMACNIDTLCMGHYLLTKAAQPTFLPEPSEGVRDEVLSSLLCSPCHGAELSIEGQTATCGVCGHGYQKIDGVWTMLAQQGKGQDVTEKVKAFYETSPQPNYDEIDSIRDLLEEARRSEYARALDQAIPYNSTVLDLGCGTGQLTNFLGISCRRVIGADLSLNALRLGERFRAKFHLDRVHFVQMNLLRPCFGREQFDVIICNSVLHYTADPYAGFQGLLPLLKPGGYIVVEVNNKFARVLAGLRGNSAGRTAPYASNHTVDEVLAWFDDNDLQFVRGVPSVLPTKPPLNMHALFDAEPRGSKLDHALVQAREIVTGGLQDGSFVLIGRKPGNMAVRGAQASAAVAASAASAVVG